MASQAVARPSALAGIWGEMIGEFFGTMILIPFGDGVVATFALYTNLGAGGAPTPFANEWIGIILGWGLAVMLGIYVAGARYFPTGEPRCWELLSLGESSTWSCRARSAMLWP